MKMAGCVALLGLVLLGCLSDLAVAQRRASCGMYLMSGNSKTQSFVCPRNYEPVCGTNGRTYPNECSLCRDYLNNRFLDKKHDGRCVQVDCTGFLKPGSVNYFNIPCTMEYSPICGTNGVTYRNKCQFCNAVATGLEVNLKKYGECYEQSTSIDCSQQKGMSMCTADYNPICASNGRTYSNQCQFCNAVSRSQGTLFARHRGRC